MAHPDFIFAGTQTGQALSEHFASADIFLFPGAFDTFGNVVIEAMASGLGVLAFRHGAAHEHIVDMDNGLTVARQNAEAFVRARIKLACQPILLKLIRESARNTAYGINWKTVINDFEAQIGFAIRKKKSDLRSRSTVPESNQTSLQQQNKPKVSAHREKEGAFCKKVNPGLRNRNSNTFLPWEQRIQVQVNDTCGWHNLSMAAVTNHFFDSNSRGNTSD